MCISLSYLQNIAISVCGVLRKSLCLSCEDFISKYYYGFYVADTSSSAVADLKTTVKKRKHQEI